MGIITNTVIKNQLDENGVLLSTEEEITKVSFKKGNEEGEFIKIYFSEIKRLCKLPPACIALLLEMSARISYANMSDNENYGGQIIHLRKDVREIICAELEIKERAFYSNLKKLKTEGFIRQVADSTYQVNPEVIGRGLFEYSPKFRYGGIKDLRVNYKQDAVAETKVEDNMQAINMIEKEIEKYEEFYRKETDSDIRKMQAEEIKIFRKQLVKLSDKDYSKTTKFTREVKELYANVKESIEDAMIDLDE